MIDLKQNTLLREIPDNLLFDERVRKLAKALQVPLDQMMDWAFKINYTLNLEELDDEILDHLLWEKHIGWTEGLSLAANRIEKINLIKAAIDIHRRKGTPYAIEKVLEALNLPGEVIEWFQYDGKPFHFQVEIEVNELTVKTLNLLHVLINEYKNKRSWLEFIAVRAFSENLTVINKNYQFPAYYPICNIFQTDKLPGKLANGNISIGSNSYTFDTFFPICNTFVTSTVNSVESRLNVELANEYRDIDVLYHRASQNTVVGEGEI